MKVFDSSLKGHVMVVMESGTEGKEERKGRDVRVE